MRPPLDRRALLTAGLRVGVVGGVAALAAGCTGGEPHPALEDLGRSGTPITAARATTLLEPVGDDAGEIITPFVSWFVRGSHRTRTLQAADAAALAGLPVEDSRDVAAPDGEEFLLVRFESQRRHWGDGGTLGVLDPRGDRDEWLPRIVIGGRERQWERPDQGTYLLLVPEGAAPEDVTLELDIDGRVQQLSLVDGSLVASDLEHLRERHARVQGQLNGKPVGHISELGEFASGTAPDGRSDSLTLDPFSVFTEPYTVGEGWPAEGMMLTWVHISLRQAASARNGADRETFEPSLASAVLELEDGTVIESRGLENPPFSPDDEDRWLRFEVPLDIEAATLRLEVTPHQRWDGIDELLAEATALEVGLVFD